MGTIERRYEDPDPPTSGPTMRDAPSVREALERVATAGESAIARALSHDSPRFLSGARQEGGQ
jgi:hypothetical protein